MVDKRFTRWFLSAIWILSVVKNSCGLVCYNCRQNVCNHTFCDQANSLLEASNAGIPLDAFVKLPPCPNEPPNGYYPSSDTSYTEDCSNKAIGCMKYTYNLTTTYQKNIVPASSNESVAVVPVLGSGIEEVTSSVIIHSCLLEEYKTCPASGFSKEYSLKDGNTNENLADSTITKITVTNSEIECCHCKKDRCNLPHSDLVCDLEESIPQNDNGGFGGIGGQSGSISHKESISYFSLVILLIISNSLMIK